MANQPYESDINKDKITWEKSQDHKEMIETFKRVSLDYKAIQSKKTPYYHNETINTNPSSGYTLTVNFENLPDWLTPFVRTSIIIDKESLGTYMTSEINYYDTESHNIEVRKYWNNSEDTQQLTLYFKFNDWESSSFDNTIPIRIKIAILNPKDNRSQEVRNYEV